MNEAVDLVGRLVRESIEVKTAFFEANTPAIAEAAQSVAAALRQGRKVLLFGNGGSAADAQHIAAEFVGRFIPDRVALPAIALTADTCAITALGNDYGYQTVFSRQIEALGNAGDVAIGISTSGNSPNVVEGLKTARAKGLVTVGFTGQTGGKMIGQADILFRVPSINTPRIQETHITLGHILCELADRDMFPEAYVQD